MPLLWHLGEAETIGKYVAIQSVNFGTNGREIGQMKAFGCRIWKCLDIIIYYREIQGGEDCELRQAKV